MVCYPFSPTHLRSLFDHDDLLKEAFSEKRFNNLVSHLESIGAKTILVENNYVERSYIIDYQNFYSRCFHPYSRKCKRLHFFSFSFDDNDFNKLLRKEEGVDDLLDNIKSNYLGYIVVRPLPVSVIGKTVLKAGDNKTIELPCTKIYTANLYGIPLTIKNALAYQEQDQVTAACASCAIWFVFQKTSQLFPDGYTPSPSEITQFALEKKYGKRPISEKGLSIDQMTESIRKMNLSPHFINVEKFDSELAFCRTLYSFLKAQIPVILIVWVKTKSNWGRHAITLLGYELPNEETIKRDPKTTKFFGDKVNCFIAHDDQVGPYRKIKVANIARAPNGRQAVKLYEDNGWGDMYAEHLIIPIYHKIRVTFLDTIPWLTRIEKFLRIIKDLPPSLYGSEIDINLDIMEWDVYLSTVEDYKTAAFNYPGQEYILHDILVSDLPKYLWICELRIGDKKIIELIADATDIKNAFFILKVIFFDKNIKNAFRTILSLEDVRRIMEPVITKKFYELLSQEASK